MIAVSLTRAKDFKTALTSGADYLELRTDYFTDQQLQHFVAHSTLPIIYTIKRPTSYLPKVDYIDLDYRSRRVVTGKVIRSFHDYQRTPSFLYLDQLAVKLRRTNVIPKIATTVRSAADLYTLARLQKKYQRSAIIIGMGELGMMTRVYNHGLLTYASVSKATKTAPGQLTVQETLSTRIFGLVGDDIQHSLSPKLHHGHHYHYQLWQTTQLKEFMTVFNWFQLPGASVTKPFKQEIIPYCDRLEPHAKNIGAVNTLVRQDNVLVGSNTDWLGVQETIGKEMKKKRVLILGRGGAAQAVAYAAKQAQARSIILLNSAQLPTSHQQYNVLVNATPVRDRLLVPADSLKGKVVMDCNYGKATVLCTQAKRQRAKLVLDGLPMLKAQAEKQILDFS